jgi:muramidase (phage lysozyme)
MARAPVQRMDPDVLLRPTAAPTDSFVRPPAREDRSSNLESLAQGLAKFDAGLSSFLEQRQAKQNEEDALLAQADFHKNNAKGYAQAVADGTIPPQASQAYVRTYKQQEGVNAGHVLEQKFNAAYESWDGKNSEDPQAFSGFLSGFLKENLAQHQDPDVLRGLMPRVHQLGASAVGRRIQDRAAATRQAADNAYSAATDNTLDVARTSALETGKSIDYDGTFQTLDGLRETQLGIGRTQAEVDKTLVDTVTAKALEVRDPNWLKYLERKVPGKDYSFADTPYGRAAKAEAISKLEVLNRQDVVSAKQQKTDQDKAIKEDATRQAVAWMIDNPGKPIPEQTLVQGEKVDGSFRKDVIAWGETIKSGRRSNNEPAVAEANRAIINGGGMRAFKGAMDAGVFQTPEELRAAYKLAEDIDKAGGDYGDILKTESARTIMGTIKQRTLSKDDLGAMFAPEGLSDQGAAATMDFKRLVLAWAVANPQDAKDPMKREEALDKIRNLIVGRLGREDGGAGAATYDRRGLDNLGTPTPTGPTAPIITPQPQAGSPSGSTPAPSLGITSRPDGRKQYVFEQAGQTYIQVEQTAGKADWTRPAPVAGQAPTGSGPGAGKPALVPEARAGGVSQGPPVGAPGSVPTTQGSPAADQPGNANPEPTLGESIRNSPAARAIAWLRDFTLGARQDMGNAIGLRNSAPLSTPEATDGSPSTSDGTIAPASFNEDTAPDPEFARQVSSAIQEAINNPKYTPKGSFTLSTLKNDPVANRIADFVGGVEANGNYNAVYGKANNKEDLSQYTVGQILARQQATVRNGGQSATGRYQIIRRTLTGLVQEMGLSLDTKFTNELQDKMFLHLLNRRGYQDYKAGRISTEEFGNRLAQEWASLPVLRATGTKREGASWYAGDGLNKALVSTDKVRALLADGTPESPKRGRTKKA